MDPERLRPALLANLWLQGIIIVTGGLVRLTGSGLGCSTWPQCTPGSFTPVAHQEQGWHSLVEFGNRLLTFVLIAAAAWVFIAAVRRHARLSTPRTFRFLWLSLVPALGIVAQAVVGGIIVLTKLDPKTVSPHFLLSAALVAYSAWLVVRDDRDSGVVAPPVGATLARLARAAGVLLVVVVVLGTAVTGSGPHSGDADESVRFGFDPLLTSRLHSAAVWTFTAVLVAIAVLARRTPGTPSSYLRWWTAALLLTMLEGAIGYTQYFTGLPIALVAAHMTVSALLIAVVTFGICTVRRDPDADAALG